MAKSASPCRVRQHPPEARCCTFTGRTSRSGSPSALLRRGPLRTVRARRPSTRLKQALKARGRMEVLGCLGRFVVVGSVRGQVAVPCRLTGCFP